MYLIKGIEDPSQQKQCLDLGKEVGLDVAIITKSVVEHIRNTGLVSASLRCVCQRVVCVIDDPYRTCVVW